MSEKRVEDARVLINELGIPQSEEEVEDILKKGNTTIDNCLLTYASMLCEQTPQGNEYVDKLITKIMQNCEPEHIDRVMGDFRTYRKTVNDRNEERYNPSDKGINWQKFAGNKTSAEPVPINLRRRERVLTAIFKGMVRNPNIKMNELLCIIGSSDKVTQKFTDAQFQVLQEALLKGECAFTREELIEGSKRYVGVKPEELQKKLQDKTITPSEAAKNALKDGTTTDKVNEANAIEQSELNPEHIKEGETKDD